MSTALRNRRGIWWSEARHAGVSQPSPGLQEDTAVGFIRRAATKRRVHPQFVVEIDPRADDAPVGKLAQARRLVLQLPP